MTTPEPVATTQATNPARDANRIARDLHETYHAVSAALDLLYEASAGSVHPALRQARRCGDDALELAEHAKRVLGQGTARLRTSPDGGPTNSIEEVAASLTDIRTRLGAAAERAGQLPQRITAAQAQLTAADYPENTTEAVTDHWTGAAEQLRLMAASLLAAVDALTSYTKDLTGSGGDA